MARGDPVDSAEAAFLFSRAADGTWRETGRLRQTHLSSRGGTVTIDGDTAVLGGDYESFRPPPAVSYLYDLRHAGSPQPALSVGGSCDVETLVTVTNGPPSGAVELWWGTERGSTPVDDGPCAGTLVDLDAATLGDVVALDDAGVGTTILSPPPPLCGRTLQGLEQAACATSRLAATVLAEAATIDLGATRVVLEGDVAVVSDRGYGDDDGYAEVHERDAGGPGAWGVTAHFGPCGSDHYCTVGDIEGDRLVLSEGETYVTTEIYDKRDGVWEYVTRVDGSPGRLSGDTLATQPYPGTAIHYRDEGGPDAWGVVAGPDAPTSSVISLDGDILAVGDTEDGEAGSVRLFERDTGGPDAWGEARRIVPEGAVAGDEVGYAIATEAGLVAAGAPGSDDIAINAGGTWLLEEGGSATLVVPAEAGFGHRVGTRVSLSDERVLSLGAGSAYLFERHPVTGEWREVVKLTPSDGAPLVDVALDGSTVVAGGDSGGLSYVFELEALLAEP